MSDEQSYLRACFVRPLGQCKSKILWIILALGSLSIAQGFFLLLVGPFIKVLFTSSAQTIAFFDIVPQKYEKYVHYFTNENLAKLTIDYATLVVAVPILLFVAGILKALAGFAYQYNQEAIALFIAKHYREKLFASLTSLPYVEIRRRSPGDWMSVIMNDVHFLQTRFSDFTNTFVRGSVTILSCLAVLFWLHWPSALAISFVAPLMAWGMGRGAKRISFFAEAFQRELARMAAAILDFRSRFEFIRAQHGEEVELERFEKMNERYYKMIRSSIFLRSAFGPILEFSGFAIFAGFVYIIGHGLFGAWLTPTIMLQFFVALGLMLRPLRDFGEQMAKLGETQGALKKSFEIFCLADQCRAKKQLSESPGEQVQRDVVSITQMKVPIDGKMCFAFGPERGVLEIKSGKTVAVVGPSGAGKSTMIKAFSGLITPTEWEANLGWSDFSQLVSMVSQDPFLFKDTIYENLIYGLKDPPSKDDVSEALRTVNVSEEVERLPQGLETMTHAIGANFSGGQIQRLVIARAILRKKSILMLDEATSAIDAEAERDILSRIIKDCHLHRRALVAITHRVQWLSMFDEIWFVEQGGVTLKGPHQDLLKQKRYQEFCRGGAV